MSSLTTSTNKSRFRQLLENVFQNAIEHGGEDVTVCVGDIDGGFYVADDGPGISEDVRDEMFKWDTRLRRTEQGLV